MTPFLWTVAAYYTAVNLLLFLLFCWDKRQARRKQRRISERSLLTLGALGGAVGGLLGMRTQRHKTRKIHFKIVYLLAILLHLAVWLIIYQNLTLDFL